MITRQDYMKHRATHREYYGAIVATSGIRFTGDLPRVRRALANGDEFIGDIPLATWDALALPWHGALSRAFKLHGDTLSLAGACCAMKEAAKQAAEG